MCFLDTSNRYHRHFLGILVLLVIPISGLGVDIYLPSLPAVSEYFDCSRDWVQLSISTYLFGLAISQFMAGPLSDTFGRRKPYLISISVFILTTFMVTMSQTIYQLLALRLIQGAAAGLSIVPMRSVISDMYEGRERDKMISYMTTAWSIGPIVAPAMGGYFQHYFGWQASFYFLGTYVLVLSTLLFLFLPETAKQRHALTPGAVCKRYVIILLNKEFLIGLGINSALYSIFIIFSVVGPFLIQRDLHYSAIEFGHMALFLGTAWFLGTLTNRFFIDRSHARKEGIIFPVMLGVASSMLLIAWYFPMTIYGIMVPTFCLLWLGGIVFPMNFMRIFSLFPTMTASANALFGSLVFLLTSMTAAFATLLDGRTAFPVASAYVVLVLIGILLNRVR